MNNELKNVDLLSGFQTLTSAVIDSSSIIYMDKCGILDFAAQSISLHTPGIVIKETGISGRYFDVYYSENDETLIPADVQVVNLAVRLRISVISEDKKVLVESSKHQLPYYNSLMVLNFLLFTKKIVLEQYDHYYCKLLSVARYSGFVLSYGEMVKKRIIEELEK